MTHRHYCTYFDHRYLPLGIALHESLVAAGGAFTLWVLALDDETRGFLEHAAFPSMEVVPLSRLEAHDPELKRTAATRSRVEYYFTCTPCLPRYLMDVEDLHEVTYLDSDLWFFNSPELVFSELGSGSVAIVPHRFSERAMRSHASYGHYNVGWLTFRNDADGRACLDWWRDRCIEWCYDRVEPTRYADQKYLDEIPVRFGGVKVIRQSGANLAPWNVAQAEVTKGNHGVLANGEPLVFFHFQGLRRVSTNWYDTNLGSYGARTTPVLRRGVFEPYLHAIRSAEAFVASRAPDLAGARGMRRAHLGAWRLRASRAWKTLRALASGNLVRIAAK